MEQLVTPEALALVRPALGTLTDDIVAAARAARPEYEEVLGGPDGLALRLGIEQALHTFLDRLEHPERGSKEALDVWRRLGRAEFQSGRSLEAMQAAFRAGARAAIRGAADLVAQAGVPASGVAGIAEAIFVLVDELTSEVVEGYVRAQSDEAGERERLRRRLAALLLDDDDHDPEAIERSAERARWKLPRTLGVLAVDTDAPGRLASRLDVEVLAGADARGSWLLVPDPEGPGRAGRMRRALAGVPAALGPTVGLHEAARSLRWARLTLELVRRGALPNESPSRTVDHLGTVVVLQDDELARALIAARLAPLDGLPAADRDRLTATLAAWLAHQRHTPSVAAELHVHPQTVRYRIGQLRDLLGDALDNPDGRFELELALRAERALAAG